MAKRYYNLEKETKEYLKACEERGITPTTPIQTVNNFCITQKNFNWSMTPTQLIEYSLLPSIWLDASIPASFPSVSTTFQNLINRSFNAALPSTLQYNNSNGGSIFLNNGQAGSVPWNSNSITGSFTIDTWMTILSGTGPYDSALFINDVYLTRGFRCGVKVVNRRFNFWNSESAPAGTPNLFSMNTPTNSINYGVPTNITLTFDTTTGTAAIRLNSVVSVSQTNRTFIPPTAGSNLSFNSTLNLTNQPILLHNLKVYNRALTQAELTTSYNLLRGRFNL
jgi:hypothetical protein